MPPPLRAAEQPTADRPSPGPPVTLGSAPAKSPIVILEQWQDRRRKSTRSGWGPTHGAPTQLTLRGTRRRGTLRGAGSCEDPGKKTESCSSTLLGRIGF